MRGYAGSGYESRKDQFDQIAKTADRTMALYAMCHSLVLPGSPFTRLDDNITNTAKERYGEQMGRMGRGGADALGAFEELFLYACPKFINANSPPYDDPETIAVMLGGEESAEGLFSSVFLKSLLTDFNNRRFITNGPDPTTPPSLPLLRSSAISSPYTPFFPTSIHISHYGKTHLVLGSG